MLADFLTFRLEYVGLDKINLPQWDIGPSLPWAFSSGDCWAAGDPNLPIDGVSLLPVQDGTR